jgi:hypothetical protein
MSCSANFLKEPIRPPAFSTIRLRTISLHASCIISPSDTGGPCTVKDKARLASIANIIPSGAHPHIRAVCDRSGIFRNALFEQSWHDIRRGHTRVRAPRRVISRVACVAKLCFDPLNGTSSIGLNPPLAIIHPRPPGYATVFPRIPILSSLQKKMVTFTPVAESII